MSSVATVDTDEILGSSSSSFPIGDNNTQYGCVSSLNGILVFDGIFGDEI